MLIVCPHCQARYEFPAEQTGRETRRFRCGACNELASFGPAASGDAPTPLGADDELPAHAGYSLIQRRSRPPLAVAPAVGVAPPLAVAPAVGVAPPVVAAPAVGVAPPLAVAPARAPQTVPAAPVPRGRTVPAVVTSPPMAAPPVVATPLIEPPPFDPSPSAGGESSARADADPVDPFGALGPAPDLEAPLALPPSAPRDPRRARAPGRDVGPFQAPAVMTEGGRDDRDVSIEPSIIIDMSDLGTPIPPAPTEPDEPTRRATRLAEVRPLLDPSASELDVDIQAVPRRSAGRFFFSAGVFVVAGVVLFVWARNDFGDIFKAPLTAANVAFNGVAPTAPPPQAPVVVEPAPTVGRLATTDLTLTALPKRGSGLLLRGRLSNGTMVTHGAITLRAVLLKEGLPVRERTVPCCDVLDPAAAQVVAQTPGHLHLSTKLNNLGAVQLAPGEEREFSVVFPETADLGAAALVPMVEVKFSEVVRGP